MNKHNILRSLILIKLRNFSEVIRATTEEIAEFTFLFRTSRCTWSYLWVHFYLRKSFVLRASQLQYFIQTAEQTMGTKAKASLLRIFHMRPQAQLYYITNERVNYRADELDMA